VQVVHLNPSLKSHFSHLWNSAQKPTKKPEGKHDYDCSFSSIMFWKDASSKRYR
jgi:hypothetical protein